jgi:hypothetical protein
MPGSNKAGDLAQEVAGAKVVKQRGTAPSGDKLGGPVRPSENRRESVESIADRGLSRPKLTQPLD